MVLPDPQWPSVAAIRELGPPLGLLESPTQVLFRRRMAEKTPADPPRSFLHDQLLLLSLPFALQRSRPCALQNCLFFGVPW